MKIGFCISMVASVSDPIGIAFVDAMAEVGFDYIELSLRDIVSLPDAALSSLAAKLKRSAIPCEACNNFFPSEIKLTGPDIDLNRTIDYATTALDRAARLGASIVVFGSSDARNVPDGFEILVAREQLADLLGRLGPLAQQRGITIVIEPLNRRESNIINLAFDGLNLVREVNHANIQLLVDFYHLAVEQESPEVVLLAGSAIRHVHFSRPEGRTFPTEWTKSYADFFALLTSIGYANRCSIEAYTSDFTSDARRCLHLLKENARGSQ